MSNDCLILASASPRRREILENLGISIEIRPADIDESVIFGESPQEMVERLAQEKALTVATQHPNRFVLAADTTVSIHGQVLGKPSSRAEARSMLECLSDAEHDVISAFCLVRSDRGIRECRTSITRVRMISLSSSTIESYIDSGEPFDKAGGYGIQGRAASFVVAINGSYTNVVGLDAAQLRIVLRMYGLC